MKKRTLPRFARISLRLLIIAALLFGLVRWLSADEPVVYSTSVTAADLLDLASKEGELPYAQLMKGQEGENAAAEEKSIRLDPVNYEAASTDADLAKETESGRNMLSWSNESGWVEWTFTVREAGWYELHLDYKALPGSGSSVIRGAMIDGQYPFPESERIELERMWKDAKYPYEVNEIGMQVRPQQIELPEWTDKAASDYSASSRPLLYRLEPGQHTLRLTGERGLSRSGTFISGPSSRSRPMRNMSSSSLR